MSIDADHKTPPAATPASLKEGFSNRQSLLVRRGLQSLFTVFESLCEGAIAIDKDGKIIWISEAYATLLSRTGTTEFLGRPIEEAVPNSLLRQVVDTGEPILLDIMQLDRRWMVVTRVPLKDEQDRLIGALGFILYDQVDALKPLFSKVETLQNQLQQAQAQLAARRRTKYTFSQFVGASVAASTAKQHARQAAATDSPVLLLGETGTGKELLAHSIHAASKRADGPFVAVNLAAIPDTLLEAEFFGVAPGAYTGADKKGRDGKFALAHGGTLFLDEVGDMPLALQSKLLRVLQEGEVEPVGSNTVKKVDVRIIAATSRNLERMVAEGSFRADFYYRINVLPVRVPSLRERPDDQGIIAEALLEKIAETNNLPHPNLTPQALEVCRSYPWPGNVREFRNVLERAVLQSEDETLDAPLIYSLLPQNGSLNLEPSGLSAETLNQIRPLTPAAQGGMNLEENLQHYEAQLVQQALDASGGNKAKAARLLGISRGKLYDRLKALDMAE